MALFTPDEAVAELDRLLPVLDEIVSLRADAAELAAAATAGGRPTPLGGVPEFKAAQARLLLCWLEGDRALAWYHRLDLGFAGRRPLP